MHKYVWLLLSCLAPEIVQALTLGEVIENSLGPVTIVTKMIFLACYVIGIFFLVSAVMQYQMFRSNPKIAPLTRILLLAFFGVLFVALPILSVKMGTEQSWSATEMTSKHNGNSEISSVHIKY